MTTHPRLASPAYTLRFCACAGLLLAISATGCNMTTNGHNVSGVRLYQQARYQEAMSSFQTALSNDPTNADAYYNLGATYHQVAKANGDRATYDQAENLYNQSLDRDSNHADCRRALAVLLVETDRQDKAFTMLERWASESPTSADARIELARLYEEVGDNTTATRHLEEAVAIDRTNYRGWKALAHQREVAGEYAQALANYQHSLSLNSFQTDVHQRIAYIQQSTGIQAPTTQPGTQMVTLPTSPARY